ncbi:tRNA lysidine(34) synthetase TilS [Roseivivax sp. CAU 1761]
MSDSLDARFAAAMGRLLGPDFPARIGLAVSGGGDSMALLALAHNWTRHWGVALHVVTVDHGLRPESAAEAAMVAEECRLLGHPHAVLRWSWDGHGNILDAARRARLALIDGWRGEIGHVLMAHTRDDVAETFLMRLQRGAGADGLAAMAPRRRCRPDGPAGPGFELLRPLLEMGREELRHYLRVLQVPWAEDPSNRDPAYDRARIRRLLSGLAEEGLDAPALAAAATRLRRARQALAARAADIAERAWRDDPAWQAAGALSFARDVWDGTEPDTRARLLNAALRRVGGGGYPARAAPVEDLLERISGGGGGTLAGRRVECDGAALRIWREPAAVAGLRVRARPGAVWDGRWQLCTGAFEECEIAALGEAGWRAARPRADRTPPHRAALALPALWRDGALVACPPLGHGPALDLRLDAAAEPRAAFAAFLLSD